MNEESKKKLKPVIFRTGDSYHRQNKFQQNIILKGLQVTTDPEKLREMAGLKTVAEVYRTLDKLAIRKEYHEALARQGLSLDYIVKGIKKVVEGAGTSTGDQLKGLQMLLKSIGLEDYKESEGTKEGWEDVLMKMTNDGQSEIQSEFKKYEVEQPEIPESQKNKDELLELTGEKSIYE